MSDHENPLTVLSDAMVAAVEKAGAGTVLVDARRRLPASGIAYAANLVLTADHVVERDEDISVLLPDGSRFQAALAGRDPGSDLALLKIDKNVLAESEPAPQEARIGQIALALGRPFRQNPNDPTCGHKTTSYYSRMIALKFAHQKMAAEALWFTTDNRLAEGCVSNVFLVKDSTLYTPPLKTPVLAGVARKTIFHLADENSIKLVEKDLSIDELLTADEIFLTNVIMQVLPVVSVEKHIVGKGKPGPVAQELKEKFEELVEKQCCQVKK